MKKCKYCGKPGRIDKRGVEYIECIECFKKRNSRNGKKGAYITHKICKENKTGRWSSKQQRENALKYPEEERRKNGRRSGLLTLKRKTGRYSEESKQKTKRFTGKKHSEESKQKTRESVIKHIKKTKNIINQFSPNIGKNETQILNQIEKENNIKILRQYQICGYFVDGYDPINNTVYEVNEKYHYTTKQQTKDEKRQQNITEYLGCDWVNIDDSNNPIEESVGGEPVQC